MQEDKERSQSLNSPDWLLQQLVQLANNFHLPFPVTLFSGGFIISGAIVSGEKYFERLGEQIKEGFTGLGSEDFAEKMAEAFRTHGDIYKKRAEDAKKPIIDGGEQGDQDQSLEEDPLERIAYIHLTNVQVISSNGASFKYPKSAVWRRRISCVDGFNYGISETSQE